MPRSYTPVDKLWTEKSVCTAIAEVNGGLLSVSAAARKYHMSEAALRSRIKKQKEGKPVGKQGRHPELEIYEEHIVECIKAMCDAGFPPIKRFIQMVTADFLRENDIPTAYFKDKLPGEEWANSLMARWNLVLKKPSQICLARFSALSNPFVIYEFYHLLDRTIKKLGLENKPSHIWNCDESGFPHDPSRCKAIGPAGVTVYRVTPGADRENTTVLAVCNAAGEALPPLIIFRGKNMQSTWRGENVLPSTWFGVTENGWMTAEVFFDWFCLFLDQIEQRPLILLFDGHMSHVTIAVIEKARENNVTLIKLPPHTTSQLQPLDKSCFGPLKSQWETVLTNWVDTFGPNEVIKRPQFGNLIGRAWFKGLTPANVTSGFAATGVYPVDGTKYPEKLFKQALLIKYKRWVEEGRPESFEFDDTPVDPNTTTAPAIDNSPTDLQPPTPISESATSSNTSFCGPDCRLQGILGPIPDCPPPPGKKWVPGWQLVDDGTTPTSGISSGNVTPASDLKEAILKRMKGPSRPDAKPRRKIDMHARVITDDEFLSQIRQKTSGMSQKRPLKRVLPLPDAESDDGDDDDGGNPIVPSPSKGNRVPITLRDIEQKNSIAEMRKCIGQTSKSISDAKKGMYYAAYYDQKHYLGQVKAVHLPTAYSHNEIRVEMDFLRYKTDGFYDFPATRDIEIRPAGTIFFGPLVPSSTVAGRGLRFAEDEAIQQRYALLKKMNYFQ